jgi:phage terminase large subunit
MLSELYPVVPYKDKESIFSFPNGSLIKLGYCDHETDVLQYQGSEWDVIGFEEATQFTKYQMDFLKTCARNTRTDFSPRIYYTCNPGGVGHAEIKRLFIDKEYVKGENPDDYLFISAKVYDNKVLMENDPEYVLTLEALPEELREAFLEGNWDIFSGQYFKDFKREKHVIEPFKIPVGWKKYVSIDWGFNDWCDTLWHAVDYDGHLYTYRQLHVRGKYVSEVATMINELTGNERIQMYVGSPDMWQKRGTGNKDLQGANIAEEFMKYGIYWQKADNDRVNGWTRCREYLQEDKNNIPYWRVFNTCTDLIKCIPQLMHDDKNVEDVATEPHDITNAPDSWRYFIMSRPQLPKEIRKQPKGIYTPTELEDLGYKKSEILLQHKKVIQSTSRRRRGI